MHVSRRRLFEAVIKRRIEAARAQIIMELESALFSENGTISPGLVSADFLDRWVGERQRVHFWTPLAGSVSRETIEGDRQ